MRRYGLAAPLAGPLAGPHAYAERRFDFDVARAAPAKSKYQDTRELHTFNKKIISFYFLVSIKSFLISVADENAKRGKETERNKVKRRPGKRAGYGWIQAERNVYLRSDADDKEFRGDRRIDRRK